MHELGIVFHVIKSVEKIGEENGLTNVASVTLELGEVSGAIPHELESCWNWAVKKTELLPEAALKIETIPAVTYCEGCVEFIRGGKCIKIPGGWCNRAGRSHRGIECYH